MAIKTEFILDIKGFTANLDKIISETKKAGSEVANAFQNATKQGLQAPSIDTSQINKLVDGYRQAAGQTRVFISEQKEVANAMKFAGLGGSKAYDEIEKQIKEAEKQLESFNDEAGKTGGVAEKSTSAFSSAFGSIKNIAAGFTIAGAVEKGISAIATAGKEAFNEFVALDKQIKNIGTLGTENFEEFAELATNLSRTVPDSASNIAGAVYQAISAGIQGTNDEIIQFTEQAAKVAVAGGASTEDAVNGLTSVLNSYKQGVEDTGKVSDTFFAAIKLGKTDFNQLNGAISNVVPTAAAAGINFDEVAASIAQMTALGVPTSQASTQLRAAMVELQKPTGELKKFMDELGLSTEDIQEKLANQGLIATMGELEQEATKSGKSFNLLFGSTEAGSAAALLTGENFERASNTLQQVRAEIEDGVSLKAYETAAQSIEVRFNILKNNIQAIFNGIFTTIKPIAENIVNNIIGAFDNLKILLEPAFTALANIGEKLRGVFVRLMPVFKTILKVALTPLAAGVASLTVTLTAFYNFIDGLLTPVLKVFDEIMYNISSAFTTSGEEAESTIDIMSTLKGIVSGIADVFQFLGRVVGEVIKIALYPVRIAIKQISDTIKEGRKIYQTIIDFFKNASESGGVFGNVIKFIKGNIEATIKGLTQLYNIAKDIFAQLAPPEAPEIVGKGLAGLLDETNDATAAVKEFKEEADGIGDKTETGTDGAKRKFESLADFIDGIKSKIENISFELEIGNFDESIRDIESQLEKLNKDVLGDSAFIDAELRLNTEKARIETERELAKLTAETNKAIEDAEAALESKRTETVEFDVNGKKVQVAKFSQNEILKAERETQNLIELIRQTGAEKEIEIIENSFNKQEKLRADRNKKIIENEIKQARFLEDLEIELLSDEKERAYQKELNGLRRKFEEEQELYKDNAKILTALENKFINDYVALNQKFSKQTGSTAGLLAKSADEISKAWNEAFTFTKAEDNFQEQKDALSKQSEELKHQLKLQSLSYAAYVGDINKIQDEEQELYKKNNKSIISSISETMNGVVTAYAKGLTALTEYYEQNEKLQEKLKDKQLELEAIAESDVEKRKRIQKDIDDIIIESKEKELQTYAETASAAKKIFGEQTAAYKAFAVAEATIATYLAANKANSSLPFPFGQIAAGVLIAAGLANVAKILGVGFKKGGYTGDGSTSEIAGVVHGQEYVVNAEKYKKNKGLINAIDKGNVDGYFVNEYGNLIRKIANSEIKAKTMQINYSPQTENLNKLSDSVNRLSTKVENMTTNFESKIGVEVSQKSIIKNDHIYMLNDKVSRRKAIRV